MKKLTHSFTTVPNHLIDDKRLDCFEFRILCYLCKLADENNMCYPSFKTISKATEISESKVKKSAKHLLELKYLSYTQRLKSDGSLSSNMYLIHLDSQPENNHGHSACTEGSV